MRKLVPGLLALAAAAAFSVWAWGQLPPQVATHFDLQGNPNGWSSRLVAVLLGPVIGLVMAILFTVLPTIDPRKANYEKFGSTWWTVANAVLVFLAALHFVTIGKALGWPIDIGRFVGIGVGALFVLLGNLMTRMRPNWFMGIRTPWTLSSDTVWKKTHRLGGIVFVVSGILVALAGFWGSRWALISAIALAGAGGLAVVVYSYILWKGEQNGAAVPGR